ncbi:hypothetical protein [Candidatus Uabimicrobium amorphum]|uniref:Uncharacterized protein n=1 Tax=Uabimicrobium amorphum TaxID=2596890 RepID=A0A5S9IN48_UABAM|nr:hypothetical protein [Candidatus Uabimicrobium amorphum]BBM84919.1 hypothetical protein UABAM_03280 [Candidatus Uabimicrobium amorphum]
MRYFIFILLTCNFFVLSAQEDIAETIQTILSKEGKGLTEAEEAIFTSWKENVDFKPWIDAMDKKFMIKEKLIKVQNKHFYTFEDKEIADNLEVKIDKKAKTYLIFDTIAESINNLEWNADFTYKVPEFSLKKKQAYAFMELMLLDDKSSVLKDAKKAIKKAKLIPELEAPFLAVIKDFQKEIAKRVKAIVAKNDKIFEALEDGEEPEKLWHLKFTLDKEVYYALSEDVFSEDALKKLREQKD